MVGSFHLIFSLNRDKGESDSSHCCLCINKKCAVYFIQADYGSVCFRCWCLAQVQTMWHPEQLDEMMQHMWKKPPVYLSIPKTLSSETVFKSSVRLRCFGHQTRLLDLKWPWSSSLSAYFIGGSEVWHRFTDGQKTGLKKSKKISLRTLSWGEKWSGQREEAVDSSESLRDVSHSPTQTPNNQSHLRVQKPLRSEQLLM